MELADGDATSGKTMDACDTTAGNSARPNVSCSTLRSRGPAAAYPGVPSPTLHGRHCMVGSPQPASRPLTRGLPPPGRLGTQRGGSIPTRAKSPPHSHESAHGHSPEWHGVRVCVLAATAWAVAVAGISLIKAGDDTPVTAADFAIQGAHLPFCTHRVAARAREAATCSAYGRRHDLGAATHGVPPGPLHGRGGRGGAAARSDVPIGQGPRSAPVPGRYRAI